MRRVYSSLAALLLASGLGSATAQELAPAPGTTRFTVFVQGAAIGAEQVSVLRTAEGTVITGSGRVAPPVEVITRRYEVRYDAEWRPIESSFDGTVRGQVTSVTTRFADGAAESQIRQGNEASAKTDQVSRDTLVLLNHAVTSYEALAARAASLQPGDKLPAYIVPQTEISVRLGSVSAERIQTPAELIRATRYHFIFENPPPAGELAFEIWTDAAGRLLRMIVPGQRYEITRDDVASVAARRVVLPREGDEQVMIPANGFNLAATISRPLPVPARPVRLPAVVLVGGIAPVDRDETTGGVPVFAQLATRLADAGFLVARYDKRAVGQSGGRAERAGLDDYATDVRSVVRYLGRRKDVDKKRLAVVGYDVGGWTALLAASRDKAISALVLIGAPGRSGADVTLEQQSLALSRLNIGEEEKQAKIDLQQRIHDAVRTGTGWDTITPELRRQADTAWFQSFLAFDLGQVMHRTRQPLLIVHGERDREILAHHAELLAARARLRKARAGSAVEVAVVPGVNHLLVPATTGEPDEYAGLQDRAVAPGIIEALVSWLKGTFAP